MNSHWEKNLIPENPAMVGIVLVLMLAARFAQHRNMPCGGKALRPVTDIERVLLSLSDYFPLSSAPSIRLFEVKHW